jgi:protein subunit release factor B
MKQSQNYNQTLFNRLGISEGDLLETFVRSGGHGGQNVNKVATCVILVHRPTGLSVRCDTERSQALNRLLARKRLAERINQLILERKTKARQAAELIRRQKRRPSLGARKRNVEAKRRLGQLKRERRHSGWDE